jgi:hypothetical protein
MTVPQYAVHTLDSCYRLLTRRLGTPPAPPNRRMKLAARDGQGRIRFVISKLARRSLSAIR